MRNKKEFERLTGFKADFIETRQSSVTTSWGVDWNEMEIARDIIQNFYDANKDDIKDVRISANSGNVVIEAPAVFEISRLYFLGSEKDESCVGEYGEGFKAASVCLLKNGCSIAAVSGSCGIVIRLSEKPIDNTNLLPVEYDFYRLKTDVNKSMLFISGCPPDQEKEFSIGLQHFYFPGNPVIGELIWESYDGDFIVYNSKTQDGAVFYNNLRRGVISGIPAILVMKKKCKSLELLTAKDRDRKAFGAEILSKYFNEFVKRGIKRERTSQIAIVRMAERLWTEGHPLLRSIAEYGASRYGSEGWDKKVIKEVFGDKYFAASNVRFAGEGRMLEIIHIERSWQEAGKIRLPQYFSNLGLPTASEWADKRERLAREEEHKENVRHPSESESAALNHLNKVMRLVSEEIGLNFDKDPAKYFVIKSEIVRGKLKNEQKSWKREVYLAESVFLDSFAGAFSVFLHEHAHVFGHDGSRGFTDALTEIIRNLVDCRDSLELFENEWTELRRKVMKERKCEKRIDIEAEIGTMPESKLRTLVRRVPKGILVGLLQNVS